MPVLVAKSKRRQFFLPILNQNAMIEVDMLVNIIVGLIKI